MRKAIVFITLFAFATPMLAGPHRGKDAASVAEPKDKKQRKADREVRQAEKKAFRESLKGLSKEEKASKRAARHSKKSAERKEKAAKKAK